MTGPGAARYKVRGAPQPMHHGNTELIVRSTRTALMLIAVVLFAPGTTAHSECTLRDAAIQAGVDVGEGCDAIYPILCFVGGVFSFRSSWRAKILGLLVGLAITIGGLAVNFLVAFAGFIMVLVMAVMLESEVRLLGRERLGQLPISAWLSGRRPDSDRSDQSD